MKKILPIAMLALAAVAVSCSSDDDNGLKNPTKDAITFSRPYVVNSVRDRAASNEIDFEEFYVWGFVNNPDSYIFSKNKVTNTGGNWSVDKTEYWYLDQHYYFSAVAPTSDDITFNPVSEADPNGQYAGGGEIRFNNQTNNGQTDLVYAFKEENPTDLNAITKVGLTFNHLLSRVMFTFKNDVSQATSLVIKNLKLIGAYSTGAIDMNSTEPAWNPTGVFDIAVTTTDDKFSDKASITSESRYIIPTTEAYAIEFTVDVYNGQQKVATYEHTGANAVTLPEVPFKKGNSYNFSATFTSENLNPEGALKPIEFTVSDVNNWTDKNEDTPIPGGK